MYYASWRDRSCLVSIMALMTAVDSLEKFVWCQQTNVATSKRLFDTYYHHLMLLQETPGNSPIALLQIKQIHDHRWPYKLMWTLKLYNHIFLLDHTQIVANRSVNSPNKGFFWTPWIRYDYELILKVIIKHIPKSLLSPRYPSM